MVLVLPSAFVALALGTVVYGRPLATLLLAAAPVLAVRCWRVGVRCTPETITVRGVLVTRHVSTAQVTTVQGDRYTVYPTIHWRDPSGRRHRVRLRWFR